MKSIDRTYFRVAGVIWALCFVVFLLVYMLVLRPQGNRLKRIEFDVAKIQKQADAAKIAADEKTRENLNEQIKNLQEQLRRFVIEPGKIQDVATEIQKIAEEARLTSVKIDPSGGRSIGTFSDCKYLSGRPITVNFESGFKKFATFLNNLEKNEPVVFINTFSIDKSNEDSDHKVQMELAVLVDK